jgi:tRNA threonylcarbamoyl adenosine modification protein (Sua5/YciO/YrdC/YwlC family)
MLNETLRARALGWTSYGIAWSSRTKRPFRRVEVRPFFSYLRNMRLPIHPTHPEPRNVHRAVDILRAGGVIIYPTDTVYGLGCSTEHKSAIERIHLIKRQRQDKPFSFVCSDLTNVSEYARVSNMAFKVMKRCIPGPYTFILPAAKMKHLPKLLISNRKTVGIRVPDSPLVQHIVAELGHPILSTSVTTMDGDILGDPDDIVETFNPVVDLILDGGVMAGMPSTVVDLTGEHPIVVREGAGDTSLLG